MKKTRFIAFLLVLAMALSLLGACAKEGNSDNKPNDPPASSDQTPPENAGGNVEATTDESGKVIDPFWNLHESDTIAVSAREWKGGDIFVYEAESKGITKKTPADTIIYGGSTSISSLDPHSGDMCNENCYETLLRKDTTTGELTPWLATEWEYDNDGNLHITLRENVAFHNGGTLTAEDVLFSLERASGYPQNKAQTTLKKVDYEASYAEDDTHLVLVMKESSGSLLLFLSSPETGIMSKAFFDEKGEDYDYMSESGGTGPYKLVESVANMYQDYEAFEEYWGGEPSVKFVTYKRYEDFTSMMIDFENGDIDYSYANTLDNVTRFVAGDVTDATLARVPATRQGFLQLCQLGDETPFTDERVRLALAHSIDYDAMIEAIFGVGLADSAYSGWGPAMDGYIPVGKYEYNPDLARQLLEEAGYGPDNPCVVKAYTTSGSDKPAMLEIVQAFANEVGFDMSVDILKSAAGKEIADGLTIPSEYHMRLILIYPGSGDTFEYYFNMLAGNGREPGTYSGFRAIPDEDWCLAVDTADTTTDPQERLDQLALAQEIMHERALTVPLFNYCNMHMQKSYIKGTDYHSGEMNDWFSWYIEE